MLDDDSVEEGRNGVEDAHVESVADHEEVVAGVAHQAFDGRGVARKV